MINNNFWINYNLAEGKNSKLRRVYPTYQQASLHTGVRMKWQTRFVLPQLSGTQLQTLLDAQSHTLLQTRLSCRFLPKKRKKAQHNKCILRAEDHGRGGSRGRVQGVRTPHPPEMTCGFLIQLVFCKKKKTMWFIGVEVEQETSAPPPDKNPGSAPAWL